MMSACAVFVPSLASSSYDSKYGTDRQYKASGQNSIYATVVGVSEPLDALYTCFTVCVY